MNNLHSWYSRKGFCLSMLDTPCRSTEDAHDIESLIKQAEAEGLAYQKVFVGSTDLECKEATPEQRHTALLTASTSDIDRDNEIVSQSGINLKYYQKNPVIAFGHDYSIPPIGKALWTKLDGDKLKSLVKFADRPGDYPESIDWFPDTIFALAEQKIIRGVSIGFLPLEASSPTEKEITANPAWVQAKRIIRKSVLLEISIVPIGCNQSCLIESVSKGLTHASVLDRFGVAMPTEPTWEWTTLDCLPVSEPVIERPAVKQISREDVLKRILSSR